MARIQVRARGASPWPMAHGPRPMAQGQSDTQAEPQDKARASWPSLCDKYLRQARLPHPGSPRCTLR
eukprot:15480649-Alexandrium_andersonii.AAC.1